MDELIDKIREAVGAGDEEDTLSAVLYVMADLRSLASGRAAVILELRKERDTARAEAASFKADHRLGIQAVVRVHELEHDLDAARAEARHLREALLHRCAVNKIEDRCPECLQIIAVLDDTTTTPATSAQEVE